MKIRPLHSWDVTPKEAIQLQKELAGRVIREDRLGTVTKVAGVDVGFEEGNTVTRAAVAVLSFPGLELLERSIARLPTTLPYIPGLLSFREIPAILAALEGLQGLPDLILCDGQGLAHPRRFGLACHLGILTDLPTLGVAKTRYVGEAEEPGPEKGAWQPLHHRDEIIGAVLRTRSHISPVYVSIGHRLGLETAVDYTLRCTSRYRLPDTTRWAHRLASGPDPESATSPSIPR